MLDRLSPNNRQDTEMTRPEEGDDGLAEIDALFAELDSFSAAAENKFNALSEYLKRQLHSDDLDLPL